MSTTTRLTVKLQARANNSGAGFKAKYKIKCGGVLRGKHGTLHSVDADGDGLYDRNQYCTWSIIAEEFQTIILEVTDIDIPDNGYFGECYNDGLQVSSNRGIKPTSLYIGNHKV